MKRSRGYSGLSGEALEIVRSARRVPEYLGSLEESARGVGASRWSGHSLDSRSIVRPMIFQFNCARELEHELPRSPLLMRKTLSPTLSTSRRPFRRGISIHEIAGPGLNDSTCRSKVVKLPFLPFAIFAAGAASSRLPSDSY
jgi:hypothetical protein